MERNDASVARASRPAPSRNRGVGDTAELRSAWAALVLGALLPAITIFYLGATM